MKMLLLHDRTRRPSEWTGHLTEAQVAVFLSDVRSQLEVDLQGRTVPRGTPACCYVFDSLPEAEAFCQRKVREIDHLHCQVFNRRGRVTPLREFTSIRHGRRISNRASGIRMIVIAWLLIAIGPLFFWWDYRHDGTLVVPTVVGVACFLTGGRLMYWGHSHLDHVREMREKFASNL